MDRSVIIDDFDDEDELALRVGFEGEDEAKLFVESDGALAGAVAAEEFVVQGFEGVELGFAGDGGEEGGFGDERLEDRIAEPGMVHAGLVGLFELGIPEGDSHGGSIRRFTPKANRKRGADWNRRGGGLLALGLGGGGLVAGEVIADRCEDHLRAFDGYGLGNRNPVQFAEHLIRNADGD